MFKKFCFKFKKIFAYVVCLLAPKSTAEAINVAEDPSEFDELLLRKTGFGG